MNIHQLTPFIRYALLILSTTLVNRGVMGADDAAAFANDPAVIELAIGVIGLAGTLVWYLWSKSRAFLKAMT